MLPALDESPLFDVPHDRAHLLKAVPDKIAELISQLGKTRTTDQDQLVLTSLDVELNSNGLTFDDLAGIVKMQIVAHKIASLKGRINAVKNHRNRQRLRQNELKFLNDIHKRAGLLTDKQEAWLQSITESLDESADDFAQRCLAREAWGKA